MEERTKKPPKARRPHDHARDLRQLVDAIDPEEGTISELESGDADTRARAAARMLGTDFWRSR